MPIAKKTTTTKKTTKKTSTNTNSFGAKKSTPKPQQVEVPVVEQAPAKSKKVSPPPTRVRCRRRT